MNILVLKMGGSVLSQLSDDFYKMIVDLKEEKICQPVIVHGGGPEINEALEKLQVESTFKEGLRVTTKEVLHVAEMVMSGSINKKIVSNLQKAGGTAIGMSGVDCSLLTVVPAKPDGSLGFVGKVTKVNTEWLHLIVENGGIPVISPISLDESGQRYNVNGDMAAAAVAQALCAKLVLVSDIPGVIEKKEGKKFVHSQLTEEEIELKIEEGIIYGGMIPKVRSALKSLTGGVEESVILNGLAPEDLRKYVQGKGAGTKVIIKKEVEHV